jgi:hypothetical protein
MRFFCVRRILDFKILNIFITLLSCYQYFQIICNNTTKILE